MDIEPQITDNFDSLIQDIRNIILNARKSVAKNINTELLLTYWKIGKLIVEKEASSKFDLKSTRQLTLDLSSQLTRELGSGFSRANLFNMRKFCLEYPDVQTLSGQLNTYLNYYKTEINDTNDNPPIGIIICAEKDEIAAEYILGGYENNVFASRYTYVLPNKDELIKELEIAMNER